MFCNNLPEELQNIVEDAYNYIESLPQNRQFYLEMLLKQVLVRTEGVPREAINYAVKKFIQVKVKEGTIVPQYTVQCLSCRSKVFGPVTDEKEIPIEMVCPRCKAQINADEEYTFISLTFKIIGKTR